MNAVAQVEHNSESKLAALERFVVDNDELLELEKRIGRFNIFDALRIVDREIKHSDFLAWLLDPNESHGQGGLFLRAILMDLFKRARESGFVCPVSPIELDGEELRGVEIRREWRHIDILIRCEKPALVIAVENKIHSGEHSNQLGRYKEVVTAEFGNIDCMYIFLTIEGDDPSAESQPDWVPYSYADLHRVLTRVRSANETSIGADVLAFLDHYLRLIRGRLMDDQEIIELCQRIYRNHRQALQLIYKHAGSPAAGLLGEIERVITEHPGGWHIINSTSKVVIFIPNTWKDMLPPIGSRATFDRHCWLVLRFEIRPNRGFYAASVWPTTDEVLRQKVIQRLTANKKEFGFRLFLKNAVGKWTQLGRESIGEWTEDDGPDEETVIENVRKKLDELVPRLAGVPQALATLVKT